MVVKQRRVFGPYRDMAQLAIRAGSLAIKMEVSVGRFEYRAAIRERSDKVQHR